MSGADATARTASVVTAIVSARWRAVNSFRSNDARVLPRRTLR